MAGYEHSDPDLSHFDWCRRFGGACRFRPRPVRQRRACRRAGWVANLANAVAALRAITTLRADFVQTDLRGNRLRGVLTLKNPGKIRFQYEKGVPILVVSDGKALTFIDYGVRQVQRWPIRNSPLGALLNPRGNAIKYARLTPATNNQIVSVEVRIGIPNTR